MIIGLMGTVSIRHVVVVALVVAIVVLFVCAIVLSMFVEPLVMSTVSLVVCAIGLVMSSVGLIVCVVALVVSSIGLIVSTITLVVSGITLIMSTVALIVGGISLILSTICLVMGTIALVVSAIWASRLAIVVHLARGSGLLPIVRVISTHGPLLLRGSSLLLLLLRSSEPGAVHALILLRESLFLWRRQIIHLDLLFEYHFLGVGGFPAWHGGKGISIMLRDVKLGILWRPVRSLRDKGRRGRGGRHMSGHGSLLAISSSVSGLLGIVWFIEMLVALSTGGIAAATAVAATLETVAAAAAAGHAQAGASDNADDNAEKDETADNHKGNSRPLAIDVSHAAIPAGKGLLDFRGFVLTIGDEISFYNLGSKAPCNSVHHGLPQPATKASDHGNIDRRHRVCFDLRL